VHVAIVGAGALGRVYGVLLSQRAACDVTFVVRPGVTLGPVRIERVDADRAKDTWDAPRAAVGVPADADVVIVTVRAEQLDAKLDALLEGAGAPIVVLTPMLPGDFDRLKQRYGSRIRAGMAGAVAYLNASGICRYWLPALAATLIDDERPKGDSEVFSALVRSFEACGMKARLELGVHEQNPATTVTIAPFAMGLDAAGSVEALLGDDALLRLTLKGVEEGMALAARIGKSAGWLSSLLPYVGKRMLKIGAALVRSRWPETFSYVELHFGRKLHAQNVSMGRAVVELARAKGTPHEATLALLTRLESEGAC
jgi:ketopantoate reductase